jgi:4-hydroxyacetophenone monooxygenase
VPGLQELQTRFILECLAELILEGKQTLEVTRQGYDQFNRELDEVEATRIYVGGADNFWTNAYGRSSFQCPIDARKLWEWLRDPSGRYVKNAQGESRNAESSVHPYFDQDLVVG